jgi:hypothetical protein
MITLSAVCTQLLAVILVLVHKVKRCIDVSECRMNVSGGVLPRVLEILFFSPFSKCCQVY